MVEGPDGDGPLRFEILGSLRAWRGDLPLDLGPGKQRAVLAVLLINANRPVSTHHIIDAVWQDDLPANGANVVQKYVAGLRRVLDPGRSPRTDGRLLTRTDAGYRLEVGAGRLDVDVFHQRVRRARAAWAEGRPAKASAEFESALGLWRSEALAGLSGPLFDNTRERLNEERAAALETRAEIELELGHHDRMVAELVRLIAEHPMREQLRWLLMLALYRSGRRAEALAAFRDARGYLAEEFGVEPGERLQRLHLRILRSDPALDRTAGTGGPGEDPAVGSGTPSMIGSTSAPAPRPAPVEPVEPAAPAIPEEPEPPVTAHAPGVQQVPDVQHVSQTAAAAVKGIAVTEQPGKETAGAAPDFAPPDPGLIGAPDGGPVPSTASAYPAPAYPAPGQPAPAYPAPGHPGPEYPAPAYQAPRITPAPSAAAPARAGLWSRLWWTGAAAAVCVPLLSCGMLSWTVMAYFAVRRRSTLLVLAAAGYLVLDAVVILVGMTAPETSSDAPLSVRDGIAMFALLAAWSGGVVHAALLSPGPPPRPGTARPDPATPVAGPPAAQAAGIAEIELRVRRDQALQLLHRHPQAARELNIGRPDLPRLFDDGGLVDINAVPEEVFAALPGITPEQARRITADRRFRGVFTSVDDLTVRGLLPAPLPPELRERLIVVG